MGAWHPHTPINRSYRTYEEWKHVKEWLECSDKWVLTVPMRNGNSACGSSPMVVRLSSYRTYEEWKRTNPTENSVFETSSYRTYEEWKRINLGLYGASFNWFLPYLWGMETYSESGKDIKRVRVLTVPMRNGNLVFFNFFSKTSAVLTVPMRNGNFFPNKVKINQIISSYRTYEEWKQYYLHSFEYRKSRSYRTYEEWKRFSFSALRRSVCWVLTVPMRNGNYSSSDKPTPPRTFLPYLWGMETWICGWDVQVLEGFLPYLWGMETWI